ncbi:LysR substrate-binding domain-containing protein [Biostraticola tofi]|uniref:LysR family glycine cleavage system transcriptional activator n=1 Tax=Biostraticola tofi TaxID=466109 RepID=A0A4R3YKJ8_9GAMM|nr:LysR substrate-binding domain-containing protein [Biostraticola tofi]TCV91928.1 LysR family glycine cleavage system transcriptional activator [Biostraticola tofi]
MMNLPSLDVLKTFAVVAGTLNFTHAASRLHITQGAVSRQIAGLEQQLGYPLFVRQARGLCLTEQGAQLLAPLQQALGQIASSLERVNRAPGTLRVKCPTCAMRWLLPRVINLQNLHPEIDIALTTSISHGVNFEREHFDAAVVFGRFDPKKVQALTLFDEVLTPVCIPSLWSGETDPQLALANKTLLHPTRDRRDWQSWLQVAGRKALPAAKGQHFDTLDLAMTAALQGYGIAIGDVCLLESELKNGQLIAPFAACLQSGASYWLIYPEQKVIPPALALLVSWLTQQAADTRLQLNHHLSRRRLFRTGKR